MIKVLMKLLTVLRLSAIVGLVIINTFLFRVVFLNEEPQKVYAQTADVCSIPLIIPPRDIVPADGWKNDRLCINPADPGIFVEITNCDKEYNTNYYNHWWCHPREIEQPDDPNGSEEEQENHRRNQGKVTHSCRGEGAAHQGDYLKHFRARVNYLTGKQSKHRPEITGLLKRFIDEYGEVAGRRAAWNYLMSEVKSGWTTFGMGDQYDEDMNYASLHFFQKPWAEVYAQERANDCGNAWHAACKTIDDRTKHPEYITCGAGQTCNVHTGSNTTPPTYLCTDASGKVPEETILPVTAQFSVAPYRANECKVHLALPPREFATQFSAEPAANMTKESILGPFPPNIAAEFEDGGKCDDIGKNACGEQEHEVNYYRVAQCQPAGSWRGRPDREGTKHQAQAACAGIIPAQKSPFLVNFRNRAHYINGLNFRQRFGEEQGARSLWNYMMGEVKTGNTTFAQEYSYDQDLEFLSQLYFKKPWSTVYAEEIRKGCSLDSWDYICRPFDPDKGRDDLYDMAVSCEGEDAGINKCLSHWDEGLSDENPPPMVCSKYRSDLPNPGPRGRLESITCSKITGWSCDVNRLTGPRVVSNTRPLTFSPYIGGGRTIQLFDGPASLDKEPLATIQTHIIRGEWEDNPSQRLVEERIYNTCAQNSGNFGFSIDTPTILKDGLPHTIYAYDVDTPSNNLVPLAWPNDTPITITCQ